MRDDLYPLTREERRSALSGWRATPMPVRRETGRLAERGLPALDATVSLAARRYGQYLVQRNRSNRMPRSALPISGVLLAVFGTLAGLGPIAVPGGAVVTALGALACAQRRCGRQLVGANTPVADVLES